jgi:hypothetical protein
MKRSSAPRKTANLSESINNCPDSCVSSVAAKPANGTHGVEGSLVLCLCSQGWSDNWPKAPIFCQYSGGRWKRQLPLHRQQPLV